MAITARNPRRARLALTLTGLTLTVTGIVLWGTGDTDKMTAETRMDLSSAPWGEVLGYQSTDQAEYDKAVQDRDNANDQANLGIGVACLGVALVGSRWLVQAAPATPSLQKTGDPE
jgi:hypothetical protein